MRSFAFGWGPGRSRRFGSSWLAVVGIVAVLGWAGEAFGQGTPVVATYVGSPGGVWYNGVFWTILPPYPIGPPPLSVPNNAGGFTYLAVVPDGHLSLSGATRITGLLINAPAELRVQAGTLNVELGALNAGRTEVNASGTLRAVEFNNGGTLNINSLGSVIVANAINGNVEIDDVFSESGLIELGTGILIAGELENRRGGVIDIRTGESELTIGLLRNGGIIEQDELGAGVVIIGGMAIAGDGEWVIGHDSATLTAAGAIEHGGEHTLHGFGTISAGSFNNSALVSADQSNEKLNLLAAVLTNSAVIESINGAELDVQALSFTNNALVESRGGSQLDLSGNSLTNNGTVRAAGGATGRIRDYVIDNASGRFEATGASVLAFEDVRIEQGMLHADGTSRLDAYGANRFEDLTLTGLLQGQAGSRNQFAGVIDNTAGEMQMLESASAAALGNSVIVGGVLSGPGRLDTDGQTFFDARTGGMAWQGITIRVDSGHEMDLAGTYTNNGVLQLNDHLVAVQHFGGAHLNAHVRLKGHVTFDGTGTIAFVTPYNNHVFRHPDFASAVLNLGPGQTMVAGVTDLGESEGFIDREVDLVNHGTVNAAGGDIHLQSDFITNTGVLGATSGGDLRLDRGATIVNNEGGHITAGAGSLVWLSPTVRGGTLDGAGIIRVAGDPVLDASSIPPGSAAGMVWNEVTLRVPNGGDLFLRGAFTNNAVLDLRDNDDFGDSPSRHHGNAYVHLDGPVSFDGAGEIVFSTHRANHIFGVDDTSAMLTLGPGQTVRTESGGEHPGVGIIEVDLVNHGLIDADGGRIHLRNDVITNTGTLAANHGGSLRIDRETFTDNTQGTIALGAGSNAHVRGVLRGGALQGPGKLLPGDDTRIESPASNNMTWADTTVEIANGVDLFLEGDFVNAGVLRLNDDDVYSVSSSRPHGNAYLQLDGPVAFTGDGEIRFATQYHNYIKGVAGANAVLTLGPGQILKTEGEGDHGDVEVPIVNHGAIEADGPSRIALRGDSLVNHGVVRGINGGRLEFHGGVHIDNTDGQITFGSGSGHYFQATLKGGTTGGGGFVETAGTFDATAPGGLTLDNTFRVGFAGSTLILKGDTIVNRGEIRIQDPSTNSLRNATRLRVDGAVRLEGDGRIRATVNQNNYVESISGGGGALTIGPSHSIEVEENGWLRFTLPVTLLGELRSDGLTYFNRHMLNASAASAVITGAGKLEMQQGIMDFGGLLSPGNGDDPAASLDVAGGFTMLPTAQTRIEILIDEQAQMHDMVDFTQELTLAGDLLIDLLGEQPAPDDAFTIFETKALTGQFANALPNTTGIGHVTFADGAFDVIYNNQSVVLTNFAPVAVPEPATMTIVLVGMIAVTHRRRTTRAGTLMQS